MKTIFKIMAMLMLALSFGNCSDDDDTVQTPHGLKSATSPSPAIGNLRK